MRPGSFDNAQLVLELHAIGFVDEPHLEGAMEKVKNGRIVKCSCVCVILLYFLRFATKNCCGVRYTS